MTTRALSRAQIVLLIATLSSITPASRGADAQLLGWNNLGMHCMDSDYSVFSILPPYNTIEAQLIVAGRLVTNGAGYTVTYEAIADPSGSFNSTAMGKGNFYSFSAVLYGAALSSELGLAGWSMPGLSNISQAMLFEPINHPATGVSTPVNWWRAEGIPISPYDDALIKNPYPMMRIVARDSGNNVVASNNIVLPVSDEMDCRACHASGSYVNAMPLAGWVNDTNVERDFRLNILRLHDEKQFALHDELYTNALAAGGYNTQGLFAGVVNDGKSVLCAACHASEALGTVGYGAIPPLTQSVHAHHASVPDPTLGITLDSSLNRAACYRCHPGSTTRCLRGAMGSAVAADGSMAMQCQSCHGTMSQVGAANRVGWFMEPSCQSCHSGTATHNNGQIRYTSVFTDTNGTVRQAVDSTFATQPDTPASGLSLYRFSAGHGGLQCEACHGSTHAEFPSTHLNDNVRNIQLQGHVGVMVECTACHTTMPSTVVGGPHGMHPVGQDWVNRHPGLLEGGSATAAQCQACHGLDYRGTVLSRAQGARQLRANIESSQATIKLFRGAIVGCYLCHRGPNDDSANTSAAPVVSDVIANTAPDQPIALTLPAKGANMTLSIISQPKRGSTALSGTTATYYPEAGFVGIDSFTFAAYDGAKNSNLGTVMVGVGTNAPNSVGWAKGVYHGLFYESTGVQQNSSGSFTLTVTGTGKFTGKLQSGGAMYSLSGQFDVSGHAHAAISRARPNPLWLELQLDLTPGARQVTGTASDGVWVAGLSGDRALYDGKNNAAPQAGRYTLVIPASANSTNEPFGSGYATISVNRAGRVSLSGSLSDGTKISQQTVVSDSGGAPLYVSLYRGQGSVLSWLMFTNLPGEDLTGEVNWIKPANPTSRYYPNGFSVTTTASGSAYTRPASGVRVLNVTNALLVLDGAELSESLTNVVTLNSNNSVTSSNATRLSINLANGLFKGAVTIPNTRQRFNGVVLQKQNEGWGSFLGTNQSGRVYFGP